MITQEFTSDEYAEAFYAAADAESIAAFEVHQAEEDDAAKDEEDCGCGLGDKCPDPPQEYDFAQEDGWEDRKNWWERR